MKLPKQVSEFFKKSGAQGGRRRAKALTSEQRKEIAKKAAKARWTKKRKRP